MTREDLDAGGREDSRVVGDLGLEPALAQAAGDDEVGHRAIEPSAVVEAVEGDADRGERRAIGGPRDGDEIEQAIERIFRVTKRLGERRPGEREPLAHRPLVGHAQAERHEIVHRRGGFERVRHGGADHEIVAKGRAAEAGVERGDDERESERRLLARRPGGPGGGVRRQRNRDGAFARFVTRRTREIERQPSGDGLAGERLQPVRPLARQATLEGREPRQPHAGVRASPARLQSRATSTIARNASSLPCAFRPSGTLATSRASMRFAPSTKRPNCSSVMPLPSA